MGVVIIGGQDSVAPHARRIDAGAGAGAPHDRAAGISDACSRHAIAPRVTTISPPLHRAAHLPDRTPDHAGCCSVPGLRAHPLGARRRSARSGSGGTTGLRIARRRCHRGPVRPAPSPARDPGRSRDHFGAARRRCLHRQSTAARDLCGGGRCGAGRISGCTHPYRDHPQYRRPRANSRGRSRSTSCCSRLR